MCLTEVQRVAGKIQKANQRTCVFLFAAKRDKQPAKSPPRCFFLVLCDAGKKKKERDPFKPKNTEAHFKNLKGN
jgi:hypothetical protein